MIPSSQLRLRRPARSLDPVRSAVVVAGESNHALPMQLSITESARKKLYATAESEGVDLADTHLRIAVVPGGCSGLTYELGWDTTVRDVDETADVEGLRLVIDRRSSAYIDGSKLHFTDGLEGRGFHFDNPQAVRNCACGESFGL